jgi:CxxC motif-containing protein (DUF1111 family)
MGKHVGPTGRGASSRCIPTSRGPGPAVRQSRARRWALAGLIGLEIVWGVCLFMGAGTRLRGARNASRASAAACDAVTALRGPVPAREAGPGPSVQSPTPPPPQVEVLPVAPAPDAPPSMAGAAERRPGASILPEDRPGPEPGFPAAGAADPPAGDSHSLGRELFARTWRPDDPRCHGGDGLGPVYNATSCVDCHSQGGPGGGGPADRNVELTTGIGYMVFVGDASVIVDNHGNGWGGGFDQTADRADMAKVHPGFRDATTAVLHRFGVDPDYSGWRSTFLSRCRTTPRVTRASISAPHVPKASTSRSGHRQRTVSAASRFEGKIRRAIGPGRSQAQLDRGLMATVQDVANGLGSNRVGFRLTARNTPPLFGAGLIDGLSDSELEQSARDQPEETRGRVHRLKDGRLGRFGWKAQVAGLEDFVLTACANELGLEVPGHHQAVSPLAPDAQAGGLDLTAEECAALVNYVGSLPRPVSLDPSDAKAAADVAEGRKLFHSAGCASCHTADLGSIRGIYSDLLLHDVGEGLSDSGAYYSDESDSRAATRSEWRTPPLWGFRDTAPYLHDGRARSLTEAVALHGGQGAASANRFRTLGSVRQSQVLAFLNSLAAPGPAPAP